MTVKHLSVMAGRKQRTIGKLIISFFVTLIPGHCVTDIFDSICSTSAQCCDFIHCLQSHSIVCTFIFIFTISYFNKRIFLILIFLLISLYSFLFVKHLSKGLNSLQRFNFFAQVYSNFRFILWVHFNVGLLYLMLLPDAWISLKINRSIYDSSNCCSSSSSSRLH